MSKPIGLAAIACALAMSPAAAQVGASPAGASAPDAWHFSVAAYGWLTNLSGSTTARGQTVDINASVLQLIQKSDSLAAWDSYFEAGKGRFGIYADLVWAKLQIPSSAAAYRNPVGGLQLSATASGAVTQSMTIIEAGALYQVAKWPGNEAGFTAIDVFAGLRSWTLRTELQFDVTGTVDFARVHLDRFDRSRSIAVADSGTLAWVDPLIGARLRHQFTPSQEVQLRADVGGFGISGGSQFSWQLAGVYSYAWQFNGYALAAVGGYRALSTNINFGSGLDSSNLNLLIHGPLIGLSIRF